MNAGSPVQKFTPVFVVGFNKTGTTSVTALLRRWGYNPFHGVGWADNLDHFSFRQHDAFADGERHDFATLDKAYPDAKFIVLLRSLDRWLISRIMHVEYRRHQGRTGWMRHEYEASAEHAVRKWISRREKYYKQLSDYFANRPGKLLAVNFCEAPDANSVIQQISMHLGVALDATSAVPARNAAESKRKTLSWYQKLRAWSHGHKLRGRSEVEEEVQRVLSSLDYDRAYWLSDGAEFFLASQCQGVQPDE